MPQVSPLPLGAARPTPWRPLAAAVGMAVVVGLMLLGGYHLVLRHLRSTKAGHEASALVRTSPQLEGLLGDPFQYRLEAGDVQDGTAHFSFAAEGKKGTADVELTFQKAGAQWRFAEGSIETEEGVLPFEPAPAEAPRK